MKKSNIVYAPFEFIIVNSGKNLPVIVSSAYKSPLPYKQLKYALQPPITDRKSFYAANNASNGLFVHSLVGDTENAVVHVKSDTFPTSIRFWHHLTSKPKYGIIDPPIRTHQAYNHNSGLHNRSIDQNVTGPSLQGSLVDVRRNFITDMHAILDPNLTARIRVGLKISDFVGKGCILNNFIKDPVFSTVCTDDQQALINIAKAVQSGQIALFKNPILARPVYDYSSVGKFDVCSVAQDQHALADLERVLDKDRAITHSCTISWETNHKLQTYMSHSIPDVNSLAFVNVNNPLPNNRPTSYDLLFDPTTGTAPNIPDGI